MKREDALRGMRTIIWISLLSLALLGCATTRVASQMIANDLRVDILVYKGRVGFERLRLSETMCNVIQLRLVSKRCGSVTNPLGEWVSHARVSRDDFTVAALAADTNIYIVCDAKDNENVLAVIDRRARYVLYPSIYISDKSIATRLLTSDSERRPSARYILSCDYPATRVKPRICDLDYTASPSEYGPAVSGADASRRR